MRGRRQRVRYPARTGATNRSSRRGLDHRRAAERLAKGVDAGRQAAVRDEGFPRHGEELTVADQRAIAGVQTEGPELVNVLSLGVHEGFETELRTLSGRLEDFASA